ncbi:hypothetical protein A7U60_g778 [Sanghuangporus baumii]|uniref:Fungal-type protein kinase domain-containing protein n=1 Tax=Sanghuangporus baumii TaxID=108892 RepID=A0A9Q5NBQ7_SANBA|nr:hypothetical protein A7U60_g778 [Sanghuangporus baumii]
MDSASVSAPPVLEPPRTPPRPPSDVPASAVQSSTPNNKKASGDLYNSTDKIHAEDNKRDMYRETHKYFLGPMPVEQFLEAFVKPSQACCTRRSNRNKGLDFTLHSKWQAESDMYDPLIIALNKLKINKLHFVKTANRGDPNWVVANLAPDISAYPKARWNRLDLATDFSSMEFPMELKPKRSKDPFKDPKEGVNVAEHEFVRNDDESKRIIGQITSYAAAQMGMSFRTHCFSVFIAGDSARLIRWDRAGAIVTRSFKYVEVSWLVDFIERFGTLSPLQRGWDWTVRPPTTIDREVLKKAREALIQHRFNGESEQEFQDRSEYFRRARYFKFLVPVLTTGQETGAMRLKSYIGSFPRRWACSLLGRNSRGTPVFDPESGQIRWLKDSWRIDMDMVVVEHKSYEKMEQCSVRNLIPLVTAGDVRELDELCTEKPTYAVHTDLKAFRDPDSSNALASSSEETEEMPIRGRVYNTVHCTMTDKFILEDWVCGDKMFLQRNMLGYSHYRIVLKEVGRDLTSFPSTTVLLRAVADALLCHCDAQFKAKILHRDISPGNVLIMEDGTGRLIDWDLCRHAEQGQSNRPGRTGTWQFISGMLLRYPKIKVHDYVDDLESFLHTSTFTLVRFSSSSFNPAEVSRFLKMFDEEWDHPDGKTFGGEAKCDKLAARDYVQNLDFPGRPGLRNLLVDFADLFMPIYLAGRLQTEDTKAQSEVLKTQNGGGLKVRGMILELLKHVQDSKGWVQNPGSKRVDIPLLSSQKGKRRRESNFRMPFQPVSYTSDHLPGTMDPIPERNEHDTEEEEGEEGEEGERKTKRIRSDVETH